MKYEGTCNVLNPFCHTAVTARHMTMFNCLSDTQTQTLSGCLGFTWMRFGGNIWRMRSISVSGVVTFLLSTFASPCKQMWKHILYPPAIKEARKKQVNLDCFLVLIRLTFWTFPIQISIWDLSLRCLAKEKFQNFPLFSCLLKILLLQWTQLYRETQNWLQAFPLVLLLFCYI